MPEEKDGNPKDFISVLFDTSSTGSTSATTSFSTLAAKDLEKEGIEYKYKSYNDYLAKSIINVNEKISEVDKKFSELNDQFKDQELKIKEHETRIADQSNKNFEVLGIFSAIIALIIIDVNIVKSAGDFMSALLLICALTSSLVIFASIIHVFISSPSQPKFGRSFYIPIGILCSLIIFAALTNYKLNYNPEDKTSSNTVAEQPVKEQPVKEQPVKEQPVKEQPVKEQPLKEQPLKEQPLKEQSSSS